MPALPRLARGRLAHCAVRPPAPAPGGRRFAWTADDKALGMKVTADVPLARLAGGVLLRSEQGLLTWLDCMGSQAIYSSVKAVVLMNRFALERREDAVREAEEAGAAGSAVVREPARVGFVPVFAAQGTQKWMRLRVISLGERPEAAPGGLGAKAETLRVSRETELPNLQSAILTNWMQRCAGTAGDPRIANMGADSVGRAVKGAAFALRDMAKRRGGARPFLLVPSIERVQNAKREGGDGTVTFLALEAQPASADSRLWQPEGTRRGAGKAPRELAEDP